MISKRLKVLSILSTFPPHVYGGGEISAINLARWLHDQGHAVSVYTMGGHEDSDLDGEDDGGLQVWRLKHRRPYAYWENDTATLLQKAQFYAQDHFDRENRSRLSAVLDRVKPDVVLVHVIFGLGYNALYEVANRDIPTIYYMHDLNLACANGGMFKRGKDCVQQCIPCDVISKLRFSAVTAIPRLTFCSPSLANLEQAARALPIREYSNAVRLNVNRYPDPREARTEPPSQSTKFLYVGRIHETKGINVVLSALRPLSSEYNFEVNILGTGPAESALKREFGGEGWCTFHGYVPQIEVSNYISRSDLLMAPSIWPENSPGVVIHALSQGLPVFGSDVGGIPELVNDGLNGRLLAAGNVHEWREALEQVLADRSKLIPWRQNALRNASAFDQDALGARMLEVIRATCEGLRMNDLAYKAAVATN